MIYETDRTNAFLTANANREVFEDMTSEDIARMPMSEFAARTGRKLDTRPAPQIPAATVNGQPATSTVSEPLPDLSGLGIDVSQMTNAEYAMARESLGMGRQREYGVGVLAGNDRQAWLDAASKKSGRTAMNESNVIPPARVDGDKYLQANLPIQGRAAYYRGA